MSREVRRVALDFEWPVKEVWHGYLLPKELHELPCPDCKNGYSPFAAFLLDQWWGYTDFDPRSTGSQPFTPDTPEVDSFARRNVESAPGYYGSGEVAVEREALRLLSHWNGMWAHHLSPADVAALIEADRLRDFTHVWVAGTGREPKSPPVLPTAQEVNRWSLDGMSPDSLNANVCVRARCAREGFEAICQTCHGYASQEAYPGQRSDVAAWEPTPPPVGDGWQVWETTSEGSPISPVFTEREDLIAFLMSDEYFGFGTSPTPLSRRQAEAFASNGASIGSFVAVDGELINGDAAVDVMRSRTQGEE